MQNKWSRRDIIKTTGTASIGALAINPVLGANTAKKSHKIKKPVTAIVIGAGNRGNVYASYAAKYPNELNIVGVAEPIPYRREKMSKQFNIPKKNQFTTWEHVFDVTKFADALIITTPDHLHYGPAIAGLKDKYDLLLEKAIAQTWEQCNDILQLAEKNNRIVAVCHVLRYTTYFRKMKEVLDSGTIGDIVSIQHLEPIDNQHMAHSFVRGNWHNEKQSTPIILSKSCHDTDMLRWLINKPCTRVSSFGSLKFFCEKYAPEGSTDRCVTCSAEQNCIYSAKKIYLEQKGRLGHLNLENREDATILRELTNGPYGKCVFHNDNDVVDHQILNLEFEDQITAAFSMEAFTHYGGRRTRVFGTEGDIIGDEKEMTITQFKDMKPRIWEVSKNKNGSGHGGGDHGLAHDFVRAVAFQDPGYLTSTIKASMASHLMGFKAEESRHTGKIMDVNM
jgi:predicted dehydrogenase